MIDTSPTLDSLDSRGRRMTDTSLAVARMYRQMLMRRSGAERVKMGASMFATARVLAVASIRAKEPSVSADALRRALFLRFYGGDFDPEQRERIAARLDRDTVPSSGQHPRSEAHCQCPSARRDAVCAEHHDMARPAGQCGPEPRRSRHTTHVADRAGRHESRQKAVGPRARSPAASSLTNA
jgi:hypothetical protein